MFRTEFDFRLPVGYLSAEGTLQRDGVMRLATAADEIHPFRDPRVIGNPSYLVLIVLSRVVTRLGEIDQITPKVIEGLFSADLAYLQDLYNKLNHRGPRAMAVECPKCQHEFEVRDGAPPGGSMATPSPG